MAGRRERKKKETMESIKAAAVKLFAEKGFKRTSIEDIARTAGIGKTTVYGYFPTKYDLFIDYCHQEFYKAFDEIERGVFENGPVFEKLIAFFMMQLKFITRDRELGRQIMRELIFPAASDQKIRERDSDYFIILERFIQTAEENGEVRRGGDREHLVYHFYALYLAVLAGYYTGYVRDYDDAERSLRIFFQQAMEGVG